MQQLVIFIFKINISRYLTMIYNRYIGDNLYNPQVMLLRNINPFVHTFNLRTHFSWQWSRGPQYFITVNESKKRNVLTINRDRYAQSDPPIEETNSSSERTGILNHEYWRCVSVCKYVSIFAMREYRTFHHPRHRHRASID